tara:strand:- start:8893 stop:9318 length:426 start_codon:yes stop_codon:yes gene_type:complete
MVRRNSKGQFVKGGKVAGMGGRTAGMGGRTAGMGGRRVMHAKGGYNFNPFSKKNLKKNFHKIKKAGKFIARNAHNVAPILEAAVQGGPIGAAQAAADMAIKKAGGTGVSGAERAKLTLKIHKHLIGMRKKKRGGRVAQMHG